LRCFAKSFKRLTIPADNIFYPENANTENEKDIEVPIIIFNGSTCCRQLPTDAKSCLIIGGGAFSAVRICLFPYRSFHHLLL